MAIPTAEAGEAVPLLEVSELTTSLSTERGSLLAVDGVTFAAYRGQTIGIVGESGSGKSMLMRSVMRLVPPAARIQGGAFFDGEDVGDMSPSRLRSHRGSDVAMVFQDPMTSLNPVRRIGAQIIDPMRHHLRLSRKQCRQRAIVLMTDVGISEPVRRLRQYPHELSGGMRQRVGIAIALACEPSLLIADEPTTALDVTVQKQILDLLARIRKERDMTMLLVTHDLGVVAGRTDWVLVMYGGRVVERGPTKDVFAHPRHPYTRALMGAIPRVDQPPHTPLVAIDGRPPDMVNPPIGCRFAARCDRADERCRIESPPESVEGIDHSYECFHPHETPLPRRPERGQRTKDRPSTIVPSRRA